MMGILLNDRGEEDIRGILDECYAMDCPTLGNKKRVLLRLALKGLGEASRSLR